MTKADKIKYGLIAGLGIGIIILLVVLFSGRPSGSNEDLINQLIAAKDSVIKKEADKAVLYERLIEEKQRTNEALQNRDSVLNAHYLETEETYKKINETLHNIPNRINRIATNNDSLRRVLAED